jgi:hypothetical protein
MVDSLQSPGNHNHFLLSEYHAVILAPGPMKLCQLRQRWPKRIGIWKAGSILPKQQQDGCGEGDDVSNQLVTFDPTLMILRETYLYNLVVQTLSSPSWKRRMNYYLSADLSHSFVPAAAPLEYWKRIYSNARYKNKILIFSRSSNAANVISIKGQTVLLQLVTTLHDNDEGGKTVVVPAKGVVFATSSGARGCHHVYRLTDGTALSFSHVRFQTWASYDPELPYVPPENEVHLFFNSVCSTATWIYVLCGVSLSLCPLLFKWHFSCPCMTTMT